MSRALGDTFREEAQELFAELERVLLELEERPQDPEIIAQVFRVLHTVKGSGAMAGFEAVALLAHEVESVFEQVRSGELVVDRELVNLTLAVRDRLKQMVEAGGGSPVDAADLVAGFRALLRRPAEPSGRQVMAAADTFRIRFRPSAEIFRRGINPATLLRELARLGDCRVVAQIDAIPPLERMEPELCYLYWDVILTTEADENAIRDVFIFVEDESDLTVERIDTSGTQVDHHRLGEILVERADLSREQLRAALSERRRLGEELVAKGLVDGGKIDSALIEQQEVARARRERQALEAAGSIRIRSDKLDSLVDLVGELVTVQARLSQLASRKDDADLLVVAEDVERLTWQMRGQVLKIRMLPIGSTFSKFRRLVRDLSSELGKEIELSTEGAETELDKTVIDRLYDPLVHLIRNCIDHGIESPAVRRAAGKPARGRISLSAEYSGANVLISVADDGAGLDRGKIRAKAIERGLLAPQAELTDREVCNLIFLPGFSTAAQVSSISGRGVGMDVVRQVIDSLRGSVDVSSELGWGCRFTLKLPLTLAIIDGLLVNLGRDQYVLPLADIEECIELTREMVAAAHGRNLVKVRGEIVPYVPLRETFAVRGERPEIEQVVIARVESGRVGFVVDHVIGENQTVIKNLGRFYQNLRGISGATILGAGHVALILDLPQLAERAERSEQSACR